MAIMALNPLARVPKSHLHFSLSIPHRSSSSFSRQSLLNPSRRRRAASFMASASLYHKELAAAKRAASLAARLCQVASQFIGCASSDDWIMGKFEILCELGLLWFWNACIAMLSFQWMLYLLAGCTKGDFGFRCAIKSW